MKRIENRNCIGLALRQSAYAALLAGSLLTGTAHTAHAGTYSIYGIPGVWFRPGWWDDKGYMVGTVSVTTAAGGSYTQASVMNTYGASAPLTTLFPTLNSVANSANVSGGVAGAAAYDDGDDLCPAWWHLPFPPFPPHGSTNPIGDLITFPLQKGLSGQGVAINAQFVMAGWQQIPSTAQSTLPTHAFLYFPSGGRQDLGTLGGASSQATSINNAGQVVGWSELNPQPLPPRHAFLYSPAAGMKDLGTLGGANSQANYIDDDGFVCGSTGKPFPPHPTWVFPFLYTPAGGMMELPLPSGQVQGEAVKMNRSKVIVGRTWDAAGTMHPCLWMQLPGTTGYAPTDPNIYLAPDSGWVLNELLDINDGGQLIGNGTYQGKAQPFVMTPAIVPGAVTGQVLFQNYLGNMSQTVTFEFRPANGDPTFKRQTAVGPDGSFQIGGLPQQAYTLHVKSAKYLAVNVGVDLSNGSASGVQLPLLAGDANNDNACDVADFGVLVNAYSGVANVAGSNYDWNADFNGDGSVDIADFGILINNYSQVGAP